MPSVKDFDKKNKQTEESDLDLESKKSRGTRRRPGRDSEDAIARAERIVSEAEEMIAEEEGDSTMARSANEDIETTSEDTFTENLNENHEGPEGLHADAEADTDADHEAEGDTEKKESPFKRVRIEIKGHEILNVETPEKLVELADAVVEEWKNDGSFNSVPVGHPLAQIVAAKGLRKAKDIEKKLEEKGVFAMAQMGLSIIKSKLKK